MTPKSQTQQKRLKTIFYTYTITQLLNDVHKNIKKIPGLIRSLAAFEVAGVVLGSRLGQSGCSDRKKKNLTLD